MRTIIYPIPATDILWLSIRGIHDQKVSLKVYDAVGTLCHSQESVATEGVHASIPVTALPPGAYFLEMQSGREDCMKPFLIVR